MNVHVALTETSGNVFRTVSPLKLFHDILYCNFMYIGHSNQRMQFTMLNKTIKAQLRYFCE